MRYGRFIVLKKDKINEAMIKDMIYLDIHNYDYKDCIEFKKAIEWFNACPEIYSIVWDQKNNEIAGYLNVMPLDLDQIKDLFLGKIKESDISGDQLRIPSEYHANYLYISSLVVAKQYRHGFAIKALYESFIEELIDYAKKDIFFEGIYANLISQESLMLANKLSMRPVFKYEEENHFRKMPLLPPNFIANNPLDATLKRIYQEEFQNVISFEKDSIFK